MIVVCSVRKDADCTDHADSFFARGFSKDEFTLICPGAPAIHRHVHLCDINKGLPRAKILISEIREICVK